MADYYFVYVDDETHNSEAIQEVLQSQNEVSFNFKFFSSPLEAKEFVEKYYKKICCILSDYKMPELSGLDLQASFGEKSKEIPFVILTGFFTPEIAAHAKEKGIRGVIEKPFNPKEMLKTLLGFCEERMKNMEDEFEMNEGFLEESKPMLEEIEGLILGLEGEGDKTQYLQTYFRLLHTIKGTAACIGLGHLAAFTHEYETYITKITSRAVEISAHSVSVLLTGFDILQRYIASIDETHTDEHLNTQKNIEEFLATQDLNFINIPKEPAKPTAVSEVTKAQTVPAAPAAQVKTVKSTAAPAPSAPDQDKLTVAMSMLDQFMETSGELTVVRGAVAKTVSGLEAQYRGDEEFERLKELLDSMYKISNQLQTQISEMRKVSLTSVFRPFKRLVRDLSNTLNKSINLELEGEDILVDNIVAKIWSNTLIHLIRNSLDHGIESPQDRLHKGKPETGIINVKAYEQGEFSCVEIQDDGKGLNTHLLKAKALEKGLFSAEELEAMPESEIFNLIFHSGFSTAAVVSDVSGRGVGMDMVRSSVVDIGGEIKIKSKVDMGTTFVLRVPIPKSVMIINALVVNSARESYLISMDEVLEVLTINSESQHTKVLHVEDSVVLEHHGVLYPLVSINNIYDPNYQLTQDEVSIVLMRSKKKSFALAVDKICDFEEVVMRKLAKYVRSSSLYLGASLLGTGYPALILSADGLTEKFGIQIDTSLNEIQKHQEARGSHLFESREYSSSEFLLMKCFATDIYAIPLDQVIRVETMKVSDIQFTGDTPILYYRGELTKLILPFFTYNSSRLHKDIKQDKDREFKLVMFSRNNRAHALLVSDIVDIFECHEDIHNNVTSTEGLLGCIFVNEHAVSVVDLDALISGQRKSLVQESEPDESTQEELMKAA